MLVDADGLAFVCAVCGLIGFALGWCGGAVDAIQRRREFDAQQRTSGVLGTEAPSDDAEFEMHGRDGVMLAGTSGARAVAWAELMRYAAQYDAEEGPLTFYEVTRKPVCAPGVMAAETQQKGGA